MSQTLNEPQKHVNAASLQYLLQEIVPMSTRVTNRLNETQNKSKEIQTVLETKIEEPLSSIPDDFAGRVKIFDSAKIKDDETTIRIEECGYNLGLRISEVLMFKAASTSNGGRIVDILDIMKFLCRDVWRCLYGKQMDNLRTNHRGTFVLVDNSYKLISSMNSSKGLPDTISKAESYLWFPCGIIRGILVSFGVDATVSAEITHFPSVTFNIQTLINN